MLKIRMKVKHLVLTAAAACALAVLLAGVVVPQTELYVARKRAAAEDLRGKAAIMEALDSWRIPERQKWSLIRDYMIEGGTEPYGAFRFDLYVGPRFTQTYGTGLERLFSESEKIPYLERYVERGPADGFLFQAAKHLAYCYRLADETERAIAALERAAERLVGGTYAYMRNELAFRAAEAAESAGRFDEAERRLAELTAQLESDQTRGGAAQWSGKAAEMRARLMLREGDVAHALERVQAELDEARQQPNAPRAEGAAAPPALLELVREQLVREAERRAASDSAVSGTVKRSDGMPLVGVGVFLREASIVNQSVAENDPYQTETDVNGAFAFENVAPGSYQLYLGLDFDQISGWTWPVGLDDWIDVDGAANALLPVTLQPLIEQLSPVNQTEVAEPTIRFAWQPVDGAAYYHVNVGMELRSGWGSATLRTHVRESRLQVPVEQLYDVHFGLSYEKAGDWSTIDPASLLGYANPDNRFYWSVEAYDAAGKLLTKSGGYRLDDNTIGRLPFFFLRQRELSEADRLVANGRYDDALAAYKQRFADDPRDAHALRMAFRLLVAKATVTGDKTLEDEARPYAQAMLGLQPTPGYAGWLMHYYYEKRSWDEFQAMYDSYTRLSGQPLSSYEQSIYATALLKQGRYAEALPAFAEAMRTDDSHRFVGNYLAATLLTDRAVEAALPLAEAYPERSFGPPLRDWRGLVEALGTEAGGTEAGGTEAGGTEASGTEAGGTKAGGTEAGGTPDYFAELGEKLDWHFRGQTERLSAWLLSTERAAMKAFVQAVMGVR